MTVTGTAVPRKEDPRLLRGRGAFTDGFHARDELWARIVRSPVAHGRVRAVDMTKARRANGVPAADVVRYVGEPLAVVAAGDAYAAEDAAELVDIDIEPLPAVLDVAAAARDDAARLFPAGNVAADVTVGYGDADAAFARAARVVETRIEIGRHTGVPLEPRAL